MKRVCVFKEDDDKCVNVCPICGNKYEGYPAISRKDNKTPICPDCGVKEALEVFNQYMSSVEG